MKKKIIIPLCIAMLSVTACGGGERPKMAESPTENTTIEETTTATTEESTTEIIDMSEIEAIGDMVVDQGLFNVELIIPADFMGEQTQEELDEVAKTNGYKSITLNDDGSATYIMNKKQHKEMMSELQNNIRTSLAELIGSEDYPNITDITTNDNFTKFSITTKSTELSMTETISTLMFYMYGGMYNIFNGTPVDDVTVEFINADSGDIISSSNAKDLK